MKTVKTTSGWFTSPVARVLLVLTIFSLSLTVADAARITLRGTCALPGVDLNGNQRALLGTAGAKGKATKNTRTGVVIFTCRGKVTNLSRSKITFIGSVCLVRDPQTGVLLQSFNSRFTVSRREGVLRAPAKLICAF